MLQSLLKSQLHCPHSRVDHSDQALFVVLCREAVLNVLAKPCDHGVSRQEEKVKAIAKYLRVGGEAPSTPNFSLQ